LKAHYDKRTIRSPTNVLLPPPHRTDPRVSVPTTKGIASPRARATSLSPLPKAPVYAEAFGASVRSLQRVPSAFALVVLVPSRAPPKGRTASSRVNRAIATANAWQPRPCSSTGNEDPCVHKAYPPLRGTGSRPTANCSPRRSRTPQHDLNPHHETIGARTYFRLNRLFPRRTRTERLSGGRSQFERGSSRSSGAHSTV